VRHLLRKPWLNADLTLAARAVAVENMWRAQRYGIHGGLIAPESRSMRTVPEILEELIEQLSDDAAALGCLADLAACRDIIAEGTSADRQLAVFEEARAREGQAAALAAVVDWLASETRADDIAWSSDRAQRLRGAA
jgi:carboxylate-amine ligase